jgi:2-polyprenyl-3-methyl-5-hydroxy-6-metoxy-1,4-benzoquinol methylase
MVAVDIQSKMLEVLRRRAQRAGLLDRLDTRLIKYNDLGIKDLKGKVDFVLAFAMVHEVPDAGSFSSETSAALPKTFPWFAGAIVLCWRMNRMLIEFPFGPGR